MIQDNTQRQGGMAGFVFLLLLVGGLVLTIQIQNLWEQPAISQPPISAHAAKHVGESLDAWRIATLISSRSCATVRYYCNGSRELYLCEDPNTGLVGGLIVASDVIVTGYGARARYWQRKLETGEWRPCQPNFIDLLGDF